MTILLLLGALLLVVGLFAMGGFVLAVPFALVGGLAFVLYSITKGKEGPAAQAPLASGAPEPTGVPRAASGGAETANERVGQTS